MKTGLGFASHTSQPELLSGDQHTNQSYYTPKALPRILILQLLLNSSFSGKFRMDTFSYKGYYCSQSVHWPSVFSHVIPLPSHPHTHSQPPTHTQTHRMQMYLLVYLKHYDGSSSFHSRSLNDPYVPATGLIVQGQ